MAALAIAAVGCSGNDAESCAGLQHELDSLTARTQDATQTWQNIEDLQKVISRVEQIRAKLALNCSVGS